MWYLFGSQTHTPGDPMKTRIATLLTVLVACFALSATGCSKKDDDKKKNTSAKKGTDTKKTDDKKADDKKADTKKADDKKGDDKKPAAGGDKLKAMHGLADKIVAKSKEACACKDKACAMAVNKDMDKMMKDGETQFGKEKPPKEIIDKIMPAMKAAGACIAKLSK